MTKIAIIDLGSNSIRMSIFKIFDNKSFENIGNYRNMVKLIEGMGTDQMLQPDAQSRVLFTLIKYLNIIQNEGVTKIKAVATAAVRNAVNGKDFVDFIENKTGIKIDVIDGTQEAYFDFLAAREFLNLKEGIICDIGGGSTELIDISSEKSSLKSISLPVGSRAISERFFACGETSSAYLDAKTWILSQFSSVEWLSKIKGVPIIGLGGSLRALAKYDLGDNNNIAITNHKITPQRINQLFNQISNSSFEDRKKMPGIGERADIIMGGLLPLMCLKEIIDASCLIVADIGVRDGILIDFLQKNEY